VEQREIVAIVGASGSGKSTLLNILGGLDTPSAGRAVVDGHDLGQMGRRERTRYRRRGSSASSGSRPGGTCCPT
jgi:ABC-type lipoprotein export system ATPase subunit